LEFSSVPKPLKTLVDAEAASTAVTKCHPDFICQRTRGSKPDC
ncbi:hypothetical protein BAE44_0011330, partial [Dichanthelium oligosanthes]